MAPCLPASPVAFFLICGTFHQTPPGGRASHLFLELSMRVTQQRFRAALNNFRTRSNRLDPMKRQLIAHLRKKDRQPQELWDHLREVSELAGGFAGRIGLRECEEIIGLLHDVAKGSGEFQG